MRRLDLNRGSNASHREVAMDGRNLEARIVELFESRGPGHTKSWPAGCTPHQVIVLHMTHMMSYPPVDWSPWIWDTPLDDTAEHLHTLVACIPKTFPYSNC